MTWSIIARDAATGRVGIIVATRFFAVGAMVPHIKTGVGAVATQALINPLYGPQGLVCLEAGLSAEETVGRLTTQDAGRDHRQVHVMDSQGRLAAHTGRTALTGVAMPSARRSVLPAICWPVRLCSAKPSGLTRWHPTFRLRGA